MGIFREFYEIVIQPTVEDFKDVVSSGKDNGYSDEYPLNLGDHILVQKFEEIPYSNHGVYAGAGKIIHLVADRVVMTPLSEFAMNCAITIVNSTLEYTIDQVKARAISQLGAVVDEDIWSSCEEFVDWCRAGKSLMKEMEEDE